MSDVRGPNSIVAPTRARARARSPFSTNTLFRRASQQLLERPLGNERPRDDARLFRNPISKNDHKRLGLGLAQLRRRDLSVLGRPEAQPVALGQKRHRVQHPRPQARTARGRKTKRNHTKIMCFFLTFFLTVSHGKRNMKINKNRPRSRADRTTWRTSPRSRLASVFKAFFFKKGRQESEKWPKQSERGGGPRHFETRFRVSKFHFSSRVQVITAAAFHPIECNARDQSLSPNPVFFLSLQTFFFCVLCRASSGDYSFAREETTAPSNSSYPPLSQVLIYSSSKGTIKLFDTRHTARCEHELAASLSI